MVEFGLAGGNSRMFTYRIATIIGRKFTQFCVVTGVYTQAMRKSVVVALMVRERLGLAGMD